MTTADHSTLEAIRYQKGSLQILNQLLLPFETVWETIQDAKEAHSAIKTMKVRGAPAIALVAVSGLAVELYGLQQKTPFQTAMSVVEFLQSKLKYLETSRPTAVNLHEAVERLSKVVEQEAHRVVEANGSDSPACAEQIISLFFKEAESMLENDLSDNKAIGAHGSRFILDGAEPSQTVRILTHCNTGSLATSGWGTALGIVRSLYAEGRIDHVFCTETRPYNQGSRLTAYELVYEKIPSTLICDSMVSMLLKDKNISAIVVGADRIAANGDTANKIGTYQLAISAKYHNVPFIVAAPITSIDLDIESGDKIHIEERAGVELTHSRGLLIPEGGLKEQDGVRVLQTATIKNAADGIGVWNPAFDVTPASLITAIVTEKGVITKSKGSDVFDIASFVKA